MGLVRVSIPDFDSVAKSRSDLPYGWFWDRSRQLKDRDGLVITKCVGMNETHVRHHMAQNRLHVDKGLRGKKRGTQRGWEKAKNEACVFVHGFNFRFGTAARKMALCAYKIQEDAPLFLFSWPSYQVRIAFLRGFLSSWLRLRLPGLGSQPPFQLALLSGAHCFPSCSFFSSCLKLRLPGLEPQPLPAPLSGAQHFLRVFFGSGLNLRLPGLGPQPPFQLALLSGAQNSTLLPSYGPCLSSQIFLLQKPSLFLPLPSVSSLSRSAVARKVAATCFKGPEN
jgi:hypothetical protein